MSVFSQKLVERSGSWFVKIKVMIYKWRILTIGLWISLGHIATGQQQIPTTPDNVCAPNPPPLSAEQLSLPFSTCSTKVKESLAARHPDQNKLTPQILETYNYPYETHQVTTQDGYILTVFRITGSPNSPEGRDNGTSKPAVYLQHGLGASSDCWNFQPGSRNLPFKLADAGYEVWLANSRGTTYSINHTEYNAATDLEYWDFSWHEMGVYDTPAVTNKIIEVSGQPKIFYVGHSQGTTQYMVSLSEIPEMNDKIAAGFLLAPVVYMGHMNNPCRTLFPLLNTDPVFKVTNSLFYGRVPNAQRIRAAAHVSPGDFCDATALKCGLCDNLMFAIFGYNAPQVNNTELPNILAKYPNGLSVKQLAHYSQVASSCTFRKYDYGPAANSKKYKSLRSPSYQLENITAPTFFFYGDHDNLGPPNDVRITASKLRPGVLKGMILVKDKLFNHVDFILAKDADKLIYNRILREMRKFK